MKVVERNVVGDYRRAAYHRLKEYKENVYANITEPEKTRDFFDVMSDILSDNMVRVKAAFKLGMRLGSKMVMTLIKGDLD